MKAFVVDRYKQEARATDVPDPEIGDHDVLVEIHAAGINPLDSKIRDGEFTTILPYRTPFVLGNDMAGVVVRTGSRVSRFTPGDEVYARPDKDRIGTFAEFIAISEDDLARKPVSLTMAEAAAVPLAALTAWQALVERADLQPGQEVLVHAGSGGVGTIAIQLAKHLGATVTTTTSTANVDLVTSLGADTVIDYKKHDFETVAHDYDVVLDPVGGPTLAKSLRALKPGGTIIGLAGPPTPEFAKEIGLNAAIRLAITLLSLPTRLSARRRRVTYSFLFMKADGRQLGRITDLIDSGAIRPVIDRAYPFEDTNNALAYVESGHAKGKVVVTMR